jgi:hypothetical protein
MNGPRALHAFTVMVEWLGWIAAVAAGAFAVGTVLVISFWVKSGAVTWGEAWAIWMARVRKDLRSRRRK